jgi:hypothetical protein
MFNACALLMYIGCAAKDTLRQGAGKFLNQATMVMNVQLWLDVWSHHSTGEFFPAYVKALIIWCSVMILLFA